MIAPATKRTWRRKRRPGHERGEGGATHPRPSPPGHRFVGARGARDESGFALVESLVALGVVFVVLLGLLATVGTGVRGVVGGRQRTGAVSLARQVVERARAALYSRVGHDLAADPTLATDPALTGTPPQFEGEELVGAASPLYPRHRWTATHDSSTYTVTAYVTWVRPATADPFKRITVVVQWDNAQFAAGAVDNRVRLGSLIFPAGVPKDPLVEGTVNVDGGTTTVTGYLKQVHHRRTAVFNARALGDLTSLFVREASGTARTTAATAEVTQGTLTGCTVSNGGLYAECPGIRADTVTDTDAATPEVEHAAEGPTSEAARAVTKGTVYRVTLGAGGKVESASTGRSCATCFTPVIGDDDRLAYHRSQAQMPDATEVWYDVGPVDGSLVTFGSGGSVTGTLDQDAAGTSHLVRVSGRLVVPALKLSTLVGGPVGFDGAARVSAVDVTVSAEAGPTAAAPSVTSGTVTVDLYDTLPGGSLGYRSVSLSPGDERENTASAQFTVNGATVMLTTTLVAGGKALLSTTDTSGTIVHAEASLTNWLRITVRVVVDVGNDDTDGMDDDGDGQDRDLLADATVEYDYGRLVARADYQAT